MIVLLSFSFNRITDSCTNNRQREGVYKLRSISCMRKLCFQWMYLHYIHFQFQSESIKFIGNNITFTLNFVQGLIAIILFEKSIGNYFHKMCQKHKFKMFLTWIWFQMKIISRSFTSISYFFFMSNEKQNIFMFIIIVQL